MVLPRRPSSVHRLLTLAVVGLAFPAAWAGPRIGDALGQPSTITQTVDAKVVSATPVIGQIAVPRQVCFDEMRHEPPRSSGSGALLGAIAGGAMGNAVGKGGGRALATGLGIFGGAILGDHIQNDGRPGTSRKVRRCEQQSDYENRVVAYNVVYEYAGQRHSTQMSSEPGRTIALQVTLAPVMQEDTPYPDPPNADWDEDQSDEDDTNDAPPRYPRRPWY